LPPDPLADLAREALIQAAKQEVCQVAAATEDEVAQVLPPVYELLP